MKTIKILLILLLSIAGFTGWNKAEAQPGVSVNVDFNTFYNDLSPYGRWVDHGNYGRVWVYDEPGFRPYYSNGHWEYTDYGWSWVSDYEWGWAPFHYGRWEEDPDLGWMWIPGYDWAPAWVTWSQDDDYYGWAPLGYGLDVNVSIGRLPYDRWVFMPRQYITSPRIYDYCVPFERNSSIFRRTTIINNIYQGRGARYMMGPGRYDVERVTHSRLEPRRIEYTPRYGFPQSRGNNNVYRRDNQNSGRDNNRMDQRQAEQNRQDNWQNNRQESRNQVFGNQERTQRNFPNRTGNNYPQQRMDRNYGQRQDAYPRQQQANPDRQQRTYGLDNNQPGRERQNRNPSGGGDQRNMDRQESRQRVFGNQQQPQRQEQNNTNGGGARRSEDRWGRRN